ncbi:DUF1272 domain-containing protein [Quadrisphaera granulorum]|uniref:DUF1272 domain-containing protein n=1 Tax=Quadrisphaera granulorum TaxID=317664 RepID=UPI00319DCDCD
MRPSCECCDRDLPPTEPGAWICSFECTWCTECVESVLQGRCLNCGGQLSSRPPRPKEKLASAPASTERVLNPECLGGRQPGTP